MYLNLCSGKLSSTTTLVNHWKDPTMGTWNTIELDKWEKKKSNNEREEIELKKKQQVNCQENEDEFQGK